MTPQYDSEEKRSAVCSHTHNYRPYFVLGVSILFLLQAICDGTFSNVRGFVWLASTLASLFWIIKTRAANLPNSFIRPSAFSNIDWGLAIGFVAWLVIGRPDRNGLIGALVFVCTLKLLAFIFFPSEREQSKRSYAKPKTVLIICMTSLAIAVIAIVITSLYVSTVEEEWFTFCCIASSMLTLFLLIRERYMAYKQRKIDSGQKLMVGISRPKPPIGNRVLLALSLIPASFALIVLITLPWNLRILAATDDIAAWSLEDTRVNWEPEAIYRSVFIYEDHSADLFYVYELADEAGNVLLVKTIVPDPSTIVKKQKLDLIGVIIDELSGPIEYLFGGLRPEIVGTCTADEFEDAGSELYYEYK